MSGEGAAAGIVAWGHQVVGARPIVELASTVEVADSLRNATEQIARKVAVTQIDYAKPNKGTCYALAGDPREVFESCRTFVSANRVEQAELTGDRPATLFCFVPANSFVFNLVGIDRDKDVIRVRYRFDPTNFTMIATSFFVADLGVLPPDDYVVLMEAVTTRVGNNPQPKFTASRFTVKPRATD